MAPNSQVLSGLTLWIPFMVGSPVPYDCSGTNSTAAWVNGPIVVYNPAGATAIVSQGNFFPYSASNPATTHTYVNVSSINVASTFSVAAWAVYTDPTTLSGQSYPTIFEIGSRTAGGIYLGGNSNATAFQFSIGGAGSCTGGTFDHGTHHIVGTFDGTNG